MIAYRHKTSRFLTEQLQDLVSRDVEVVECSFERGLGSLQADVAVAATALVMSQLGPWLSPRLPVVVLKRTISRVAWEQVMRLPARAQALVVNDAQETAMDTLALLHELGAAHLKLVPYWPDVNEVPPASIAVVPDERHLVPAWVEQVVDLGPRVIDPSSVVDLLTMLDRYDGESHTRLLAYSDTVMARPGLRHTLHWFTRAKSQLETVLDEMQEGVVAYDGHRRVTLVNRRAEVLLGREGWQMVGRSFPELAAELGLDGSLTSHPDRGPQVANLQGRQVVARHRPLSGEALGGMLMLRDVTEINDLERRLRRELKTRGHVTRYSFADIVGQSTALRTTVRKAQKLASGNGTILIQGESGTGKELIAQAIHAASRRAPYPFVAVNCAAVPETLLESELFGYEEGAFTGARRGGKEGLFEQAHMGTIFLDEIGELSPGLQARLLRVLQEREVLRIGAERLRPIDVRVICATNQDLEAMVEQRQFRADLYYRLNVLTLTVPPLRERHDDIPDLVRSFLAGMNDRRQVPQAVMELLLRHDWPGNVRELCNCVAYMAQVADGPFTPDDLPTAVLPRVQKATRSWPQDLLSTGALSAHLVATAQVAADRELRFLLGALLPSPLAVRVGRRSLAQQAAQLNLHLTEAQVRRRLEHLARLGLVTMRHGGAPKLTEAGLALAHRLTGAQLG